MNTSVTISLDAVIVAVTAEAPRVLTAECEGVDVLPGGALDPQRDPTLERGLRDRVEAASGLALGYVEQLYTFGDRAREARSTDAARVIGVAYLALVLEQTAAPAPGAHWRDVYAFLPWEDWRAGRPPAIAQALAPRLHAWAGADRHRRERVDLTFGLDGAPWDPERTLERYELLWEIGLAAEAPHAGTDLPRASGRAMGLDHRRMLATALGRLRGKLRYRPVVFELVPEAFTLTQLQRVIEALAGMRLHMQNFRRLIEHAGLVEATGQRQHATGGRPAVLFRFRREVFRERPQPGVYYPGAWWSR
ncbi:MAG TPA: hypothetical protein VND63_07290 [Rhodanobacteraceae bacterium]|nr:hypothetical protein [Rhodanobacteraceae bacterium]